MPPGVTRGCGVKWFPNVFAILASANMARSAFVFTSFAVVLNGKLAAGIEAYVFRFGAETFLFAHFCVFNVHTSECGMEIGA